MITVVSAYFESGEREMKLPVNQPTFKGVKNVLYTNVPDKIDKNSNWEVKHIPLKDKGRIKARHIKSMIHEYEPNSNYWLWIDANMLLMEDPNYMLDSYLKSYDICALPHPERHNYWEEAVICSEFFEHEVDNIQNLIDIFYQEKFMPFSLCETGCLLRVNNPQIINFNKIWWEHIKICHRDQISFPYSVWKANLRFTTFPGTNSHNELRFEYKDYIPQWQGIVRTWSGGYTDRKTILK